MKNNASRQEKTPKNYLSATNSLIALKRYDEAQEIVQIGLAQNPENLTLLYASANIYREIHDRKKSLEPSKMSTTYDPSLLDNCQYEIEDLMALSQLEEAQDRIQIAMKQFPPTQKLLKTAIQIYRLLGNHSKSLQYAELFINHYPNSWKGYLYASQDKLILGNFQLNDYSQELNSTRPAKNNGQIRSFWKYLYRTKNTKKTDLWINSYKLIRQSADNQISKQCIEWQPFQYWSQGKPPKQIRKVTSLWNEIFKMIGLPPIRQFDQKSASAYITKNCPELITPFKTAFTHAVQADVFRVAFAQKNNCIWLDSDLYPNCNTIHHLQELLSKQKTTLFFRWYRPWITNAFFISLSSSTFFGKILESTKNINFNNFPKSKETILSTFGPGRYNQELDKIIKYNPEMLESKSTSITFQQEQIAFTNDYVFANMKPPYRLKYKNTNDNWQKLVGAR